MKIKKDKIFGTLPKANSKIVERSKMDTPHFPGLVQALQSTCLIGPMFDGPIKYRKGMGKVF